MSGQKAYSLVITDRGIGESPPAAQGEGVGDEAGAGGAVVSAGRDVLGATGVCTRGAAPRADLSFMMKGTG